MSTDTGINSTQISKWFTGTVKGARRSNLLKLADYFGVNVKWLENGRGPKYKIDDDIDLMKGAGYATTNSRMAKLGQVPLLGKVPAGIAEDIPSDDIIKYISLPNAPENSFALKVIGESMMPEIRPNDYVLFVIDRQPQSGDVVVVNDEFGDSMIKRLKIKDNEHYLTSDNPAYPTYKANSEYRIMGVVIGGWRELTVK